MISFFELCALHQFQSACLFSRSQKSFKQIAKVINIMAVLNVSTEHFFLFYFWVGEEEIGSRGSGKTKFIPDVVSSC